MSMATLDPPRPRGQVGIYQYQRQLRKFQVILEQEGLRMAELFGSGRARPNRTFYSRIDRAMDDMVEAAVKLYEDGGEFEQLYKAGLMYGDPAGLGVMGPTDRRFLKQQASEGLAEARRTAEHSKADARRMAKDLRKEGVTNAKEARKVVEGKPIAGAVYSNGKRYPADVHSTMQARTRAQKAYNVGTIRGAAKAKCTAFEIKDGPLCGMSSHDDGDKADGQILNEADAMKHLVSHPSCQRVFVPRFDVDKPPSLGDKLRQAFESLYLSKGEKIAAGGALTGLVGLGVTVASSSKIRGQLIDTAIRANPQFMRFTARIDYLAATFGRDVDGNFVQLPGIGLEPLTADGLREEVNAFGDYAAWGQFDNIPGPVKFVLTGVDNPSERRLLNAMEQFDIFNELHTLSHLDDNQYKFRLGLGLDFFERFSSEVLDADQLAAVRFAPDVKPRFGIPRIRGTIVPRVTFNPYDIVKVRTSLVNKFDYLRKEQIPEYLANRRLILNREDLVMIAKEEGIEGADDLPTLQLMAQLEEKNAMPGVINTEKLRLWSPESLIDYAKSVGITEVDQIIPGPKRIIRVAVDDADHDALLAEIRRQTKIEYLGTSESADALRSVGGRYDIEDLGKKSRREIIEHFEELGEEEVLEKIRGMERSDMLGYFSRRNRETFSALSDRELLELARRKGVYQGDSFLRDVVPQPRRTFTPISPGSVIVEVDKATKEQLFEALVEWIDLPGEVSRYSERQLKFIARRRKVSRIIVNEMRQGVVRKRVARVLPDNESLVRKVTRITNSEDPLAFVARQYSFINNPGEMATRRQVVTALTDLRRAELDKMKFSSTKRLREVVHGYGIDELDVVEQGEDIVQKVPLEMSKKGDIIRAMGGWGHGFLTRVSINPRGLMRLGFRVDPAGRVLPDITVKGPGPFSWIRFHTDVNEAGSISSQLRFITKPIPILREVKINFNNHRLINIVAEMRILGWSPFGISRTLKITPEQAVRLVKIAERRFEDAMDRVVGTLADRFGHTMSMLHIQRKNVIALRPDGRMGSFPKLPVGENGQVQRFHGFDVSEIEGQVPTEMMEDIDRALNAFHESYPGVRTDGIKIVMSDDLTLLKPMHVTGFNMANRSDISIQISRNIAKNYDRYLSRLEEQVTSGWSPALVNPRPVSQMTHELSHILDMSMTPNERRELMRRISDAGPGPGEKWRVTWESALRHAPQSPGDYFVSKNRKQVSIYLSRYAGTRKGDGDIEFFSEAFTEYWNSPAPRQPADVVGSYMDELFGPAGRVKRTDVRYVKGEHPRPFDPLYRYSRSKLPSAEDWEEVSGWGRRKRGFASRVRRIFPGDPDHPWTGSGRFKVPDVSGKKIPRDEGTRIGAHEVSRQPQPKPPSPRKMRTDLSYTNTEEATRTMLPQTSFMRTSFDPTGKTKFDDMLRGVSDVDPRVKKEVKQVPVLFWDKKWIFPTVREEVVEQELLTMELKRGITRSVSVGRDSSTAWKAAEVGRSQRFMNDTLAIAQGLQDRFPGWQQRNISYMSWDPLSIPGTLGHTMNRTSDWAEIVLDESVSRNWGIPDPRVTNLSRHGWFSAVPEESNFAYTTMHETGHQLFFTVQRYGYLKNEYLNDLSRASSMLGRSDSANRRAIAIARELAEDQLRELDPSIPADPMEDLYQRLARAINKELKKQGIPESEFVSADDVRNWSNASVGDLQGIKRSDYAKVRIVNQQIQKNLSIYGATNMHEMAAESFSEYMMSPKPRAIAQEFGEWFDDYLGPGSVLARKNITPEALSLPPGISMRYFLDLEDDAPGAVRRMLDRAKDSRWAEKVEEQAQEYADKFKTTIERAREEVQAALDRLREGRIHMRISSPALVSALNDGEVKNSLDLDSEWASDRRSTEKILWEIPEEAPGTERPVYGYLDEVEGMSSPLPEDMDNYGELTVVWKDKVKDRSTFTMDDSWTIAETGRINSDGALSRPGSLVDPQLDDTGFFRINKSGAPEVPQFIEVQIHGGLPTDEIEKVWVPTPLDALYPDMQLRDNLLDSYDELIPMLDDAGIDWEFSGDYVSAAERDELSDRFIKKKPKPFVREIVTAQDEHDKYIANVERLVRQEAEEIGLDYEDLADEMSDMVSRIFTPDDSPIVMRVKAQEGLLGILESGEFVGSFNGPRYLENMADNAEEIAAKYGDSRRMRELWERRLWGRGATGEAANQRKLHYAYADNVNLPLIEDVYDPATDSYVTAPSERFLDMYGEIKIVFKDKVKARSTVTFPDLDTMNTGSTTPFLDPDWRSLTAINSPDSPSPAAVLDPPYVEVQIHGDLKVDDIDHIILPRDGVDYSALASALDEHGIPWEFIDGGTIMEPRSLESMGEDAIEEAKKTGDFHTRFESLAQDAVVRGDIPAEHTEQEAEEAIQRYFQRRMGEEYPDVDIPNGTIEIRTHPAALEGIISDGRIKSSVEIWMEAADLDPDELSSAAEMADQEWKMFGVPLDGNDPGRPIYGYVAGTESTSDQLTGFMFSRYGDVRISLKPEVNDRATVTFGDSGAFAMEGNRRVIGSPMRDPQWYSTAMADYVVNAEVPEADGTWDLSWRWDRRSVEYVEAQIHGGIKIEDIDVVLLPSTERIYQNYEMQGTDMVLEILRLETKLHQAGIKTRRY